MKNEKEKIVAQIDELTKKISKLQAKYDEEIKKIESECEEECQSLTGRYEHNLGVIEKSFEAMLDEKKSEYENLLGQYESVKRDGEAKYASLIENVAKSRNTPQFTSEGRKAETFKEQLDRDIRDAKAQADSAKDTYELYKEEIPVMKKEKESEQEEKYTKRLAEIKEKCKEKIESLKNNSKHTDEIEKAKERIKELESELSKISEEKSIPSFGEFCDSKKELPDESSIQDDADDSKSDNILMIVDAYDECEVILTEKLEEMVASEAYGRIVFFNLRENDCSYENDSAREFGMINADKIEYISPDGMLPVLRNIRNQCENGGCKCRTMIIFSGVEFLCKYEGYSEQENEEIKECARIISKAAKRDEVEMIILSASKQNYFFND